MKKNALFTIDEDVHDMLHSKYGRKKSSIVENLIKEHLCLTLSETKMELKMKVKQKIDLDKDIVRLEKTIKEQEKREKEILDRVMPEYISLSGRKSPDLPPNNINPFLKKQGLQIYNKELKRLWEEYS